MKITLTNLANLSNRESAVVAINNNNDLIETALENTLSRDGTSPNVMASNLDMDSYRILNLPVPINDTDPVRLVDMEDAIAVIVDPEQGAGLAVGGTPITDGNNGRILYNNNSVLGEKLLAASDVSLGNVDNTSDATKNTAVATLTNKTLTTPDINGGTADALTSLGVRSTASAFDLKLASQSVYTGDRTLILNTGDGNRSITLGAGNLNFASNFTTTGANPITFATTGSTSLTLPVSGTLVNTSSAQTLTNKTIDGASNTITNVSLSTGVTGNLPVTRLASGTGASASSYWRGDGVWGTPAGGGTVTGPGSSVDGHFAQFDGTSGGILKGGLAAPTGTIVGTTDTQALTNKSINGLTVTSSTGTLTVPDGVVVTGPAASGTVQTTDTTQTVTGVKTFGSSGAVGRLKVAGTTSGSTILDATAVANGTLTLPAATDTLIGKATTDTLTNKTFNTAGTGNSFSINSVAVTDNTGTGLVARQTSPTFITPTLGVAAATSLNTGSGAIANIFSGTFTPTYPGGGTNVDAVVPNLNIYMRVGNVCHVSGRVQVDATAAGPVAFTLTLPIASSMTVTYDLNGVAASNAGTYAFLSIFGDATNDTASFAGTVTDLTNRLFHYTYTYRIL